MRQLQFVGVADDGAHLLLQDDGNVREQFLLPIDERLRAASRGDRSRVGQIEIEMDATLRPREIQARIRAGESPEEVADAAGAPLQRVMRFAYPVLQEREQVAVEARRTRIRRSEGAQQLGEQVDDRLTRQGIDPDTADWDAYRREDGTWWLTLSWMAGKTPRRAQWSFDLAGRTLTPADDLAAELQAEQPRRRTIAAVPFVPDNDPVDDEEYVEELAEQPAAQPAPPPAPNPRPVPANGQAQANRPVPTPRPSVITRRDPTIPRPSAEPYGWAEPVETTAPALDRVTEAAPQPVPAPEQPTPEPEPAAKPAAKAGRKPKVPSWDDIVFGTRGRR